MTPGFFEFLASPHGARCLHRIAPLALALFAITNAATPVSAEICTAPRDLIALDRPLPNLIKHVKARQPVQIVALGSSSTSGTGASSRKTSYPARLEAELRAAWPSVPVEVANAGIGGELAADMLRRIDKDVLARKPQLVIWQTGVNDAIRAVPLAEFTSHLATGIRRMKAAGSDVLILDHQLAPRIEKLANGRSYLHAMREVAAAEGVPIVHRFQIMKHLVDTSQFSLATMLDADQFHLNDRSYACIGHLVARALDMAVMPQ